MSRRLRVLALVAGCLPVAPGIARGIPPSPSVIAQRLFDAFNRHDADGLARLYAEDAELISPDHPAPLHGPASVRSVYAALFAQLQDVRDRIVRTTAQGDRVAVEFVSTGCAVDRSHCIALPIASVLTVREGRIVRDVSYFDPAGGGR